MLTPLNKGFSCDGYTLMTLKPKKWLQLGELHVSVTPWSCEVAKILSSKLRSVYFELMEQVSVEKLRSALGDYLDKVNFGRESFLVTRYGRHSFC